MKKLILISLTLLLISCNECPESEPIDCPEVIVDTQAIIINLKAEWEDKAFEYWNKEKYNAFAAIDSMKEIAILEVYNVKEAAIYQVDTMRVNMFTERDRIIAGLDSVRGIKSFNDLAILHDSISEIDFIGFDSIANGPFIRFK